MAGSTLAHLRWLGFAALLGAIGFSPIGPGNLRDAVVRADGPTKPAPAASRPTPAQRGAMAARTDITRDILVTGELKASKSRDINVPNIRSGFQSTVTFLATEGAPVRQGQRLVEFDASGLLSQQSEAERRLDEAKLKIEKAKADLEAQKSDLLADLAQADGNLKVAELYAKITKDLLPANTFQKYRLDLEKATLARDKAKERLANYEVAYPSQMALAQVEKAQAEIDLKKIDADIALLQIDAPQDGIVIYGDNWASNRKVQVGDTLFPQMVVLTIPDLGSMQVVGYIYDTELPFVSVGMTCEFHIDSIPGSTWRGKIVSITSVANRKGFASQHKVFRAVVQPDAVEKDLWKPGMTVRLEIPVSLASSVVTIPREYLGFDEEGRYFVRKGTEPKTAVIQPVEVGVFNERTVQILSGLAEGEHILEVRQTTETKR